MKNFLKKFLLYIFAAIFLTSFTTANATSIKIADREMKSTQAAKTTFGERIDAIVATGGEEVSGRVKLGLLLHGDGHILIDDKVKNTIYRRLREKFHKDEFAIMKATDVATFLLQKGDRSKKMLPEMNERDYVTACVELSYDYLLVISFVHDETWNAPIMNAEDGGEETVWMKIRLVYPRYEGYLYRNDFAITGTSTKNHIRCRLNDEMVDSMTQEFLDDLAIDYRDETYFDVTEDKKQPDMTLNQEEEAKRAHEKEIDAILEGKS